MPCHFAATPALLDKSVGTKRLDYKRIYVKVADAMSSGLRASKSENARAA